MTFKEINHAVQLKLFILADSHAGPNAIEECLSQVTLLMNATTVAGSDLRRALHLLHARNMLTTDHKILIQREAADVQIRQTPGLGIPDEAETLLRLLDNLPDPPDEEEANMHNGEN